MIQAIEAVVDERGNVQLLETVQLSGSQRALVLILDEKAPQAGNDAALLSEAALAQDWNRPEEDAAWAHLQSAR